MQGDIEALRSAHQNIDGQEVRRAVGALEAAERVLVLGRRMSTPQAGYLYWLRADRFFKTVWKRESRLSKSVFELQSEQGSNP